MTVIVTTNLGIMKYTDVSRIEEGPKDIVGLYRWVTKGNKNIQDRFIQVPFAKLEVL